MSGRRRYSERSRGIARMLGGWAGYTEALPLYRQPKRVLIEVALRLGASCAGSCDDFDAGYERVNEEIETLREAKLI